MKLIRRNDHAKKPTSNSLTIAALLGILFVCTGYIGRAQTTVTIGTGSSTDYYYGPYYRSSSGSSFNYSRYAYLYTAAELNIPPGSIITKVEWHKASGTISGNNDFDIYMDNTSAASLSSGTTWNTLSSGVSTVYSSTTQSFTTTGWVPFTLTAPFEYTGSNLLILTNHHKLGSASAGNYFYYTSASGKSIGYASSSAPSGSTTLSSSYGNNRPNIRITWVPGCPTDIITPPMNVSTCVNDDIFFTADVDSAQAYRWQVNSGGGWTNLADNAMYSGTGTDSLRVANVSASMDNYWFRLVATNTIKNCSITTDSANITTVPATLANILITAGPDTNICKGELLTFHTGYTYGGSSPGFRWLKNGVTIPGETNGTFTSSQLSNGDYIQCVLISSKMCTKPVTSQGIIISVDPIVTASVNLSVSFHGGNSYTFEAHPQNGGLNPQYYWYVNGKLQPAEKNSTFTSTTLMPFDKVTVEMESSLACASPHLSSSNLATTGINTMNDNNLSLTLVPNPTIGQFIISGRLNEPLQAGKEIAVTITNSMGQVVYNRSFNPGGDKLNIPVTLDQGIANGIYMVNCTINDKVTHTRFVLQR